KHESTVKPEEEEEEEENCSGNESCLSSNHKHRSAANDVPEFDVGHIILDVQPTVQALLCHWKARRCDFCFKLAQAGSKLRRCTGCRFMFYCGRECQQADWQSCHRVECKGRLPAAYRSLSSCVDALGRPRWQLAQIQLALSLLIKWRLVPNFGWNISPLLIEKSKASSSSIRSARSPPSSSPSSTGSSTSRPSQSSSSSSSSSMQARAYPENTY